MADREQPIPGGVSDLAVKSGVLALALGAIAATSGAAHASVVVTQVSPGVDVSTDSATIFYPTTGGTAAYTLSDGSISTAGGSSNLIELNSGDTYAAKLSAGTVIGPSSFAPIGTSATTATLGSPFKGSYYVGLDVVTAPNVNNYGWAYITPGSNAVSSTVASVTSTAVTSSSPFPDPALSAFAFQTTPNTPITTPAPVPEPSSLALLAVGAAGVLGMRRKARAA